MNVNPHVNLHVNLSFLFADLLTLTLHAVAETECMPWPCRRQRPHSSCGATAGLRDGVGPRVGTPGAGQAQSRPESYADGGPWTRRRAPLQSAGVARRSLPEDPPHPGDRRWPHRKNAGVGGGMAKADIQSQPPWSTSTDRRRGKLTWVLTFISYPTAGEASGGGAPAGGSRERTAQARDVRESGGVRSMKSGALLPKVRLKRNVPRPAPLHPRRLRHPRSSPKSD